MDKNMFDLGLDVATILAELPDPVITLTGADSYTVQDTADHPLLALSVYGKSVQDGTPTPDAPIDIVSVGDDGAVIITVGNGSNIALSAEITSGLPFCSVGNVRDELVYNADGTGKIIKRTAKIVLDGSNDEAWQISDGNAPFQIRLEDGSLWESRLDLPRLYCSKYERVPQGSMWGSYDYMVSTDTNGTLLAIRDISVTTLEAFKAKLNAGPMVVVYVLATPKEIKLSAAEMAELQKLQSYEGTTSIYNDEQAEMFVKMLRSDYDMKYIEWFKESQTWTCPKAGKWKVICVGGGASGGLYDSTENAVKLTPTTAGGTTSFGSIISADGAPSTKDSTVHGDAAAQSAISGYGGYTGTSYGGVPMVGGDSVTLEFGAGGGSGNAAVMAFSNPTAAVGYGAGGGAVSLKEAIGPIAGRAGSIESTIVDLEEGQTIMCTVGKGGQTTDATVMGSGADGVIVVQYLGY